MNRGKANKTMNEEKIHEKGSVCGIRIEQSILTSLVPGFIFEMQCVFTSLFSEVFQVFFNYRNHLGVVKLSKFFWVIDIYI